MLHSTPNSRTLVNRNQAVALPISLRIYEKKTSKEKKKARAVDCTSYKITS